jgi:iron(III) transport system substrate-binding protein
MRSHISGQRWFRGLLCAVVVPAGMAIAACGSSTPQGTGTGSAGSAAPLPVPAKLRDDEAAVKGLSPAARDAKLRSLAKAEGGEVNVYTSLSKLVVTPFEAAFAKQYPDVKLNVYRASSEDVTSKLLSERSAGKSGADIVETNGTNMLTFQRKNNVLVPYTGSPYRSAIPKSYRFATFTADRVEKFAVAWNTKLVSDPPKSFQDLADPKWKGKLAMEPTDIDWFAALYTYLGRHGGPGGSALTASSQDAMWRSIAGNSQLINGHTEQATALAAGQVQGLVSGHAQSVEQLEAKGAPVTFTPSVTPVVERPQGIGLVYGVAHPAAALLFYDWALSPAGQRALQQNGVEAANPAFPDPHFAAKPLTIRVDLAPVVTRYQEWQKKYESFTGPGAGG